MLESHTASTLVPCRVVPGSAQDQIFTPYRSV